MGRDVTFPRLNPFLFLVNLAACAALLAACVWSGRRGRRTLHYRLVALALLALTTAIVQAEILGRSYSFTPLRLGVHLACAALALLALPFVALTGLRLRSQPAARPAHRRAVAAFLSLTGVAIVSAGWMFLDAEPKP